MIRSLNFGCCLLLFAASVLACKDSSSGTVETAPTLIDSTVADLGAPPDVGENCVAARLADGGWDVVCDEADQQLELDMAAPPALRVVIHSPMNGDIFGQGQRIHALRLGGVRIQVEV